MWPSSFSVSVIRAASRSVHVRASYFAHMTKLGSSNPSAQKDRVWVMHKSSSFTHCAEVIGACAGDAVLSIVVLIGWVAASC